MTVPFVSRCTHVLILRVKHVKWQLQGNKRQASASLSVIISLLWCHATTIISWKWENNFVWNHRWSKPFFLRSSRKKQSNCVVFFYWLPASSYKNYVVATLIKWWWCCWWWKHGLLRFIVFSCEFLFQSLYFASSCAEAKAMAFLVFTANILQFASDLYVAIYAHTSLEVKNVCVTEQSHAHCCTNLVLSYISLGFICINANVFN